MAMAFAALGCHPETVPPPDPAGSAAGFDRSAYDSLPPPKSAAELAYEKAEEWLTTFDTIEGAIEAHQENCRRNSGPWAQKSCKRVHELYYRLHQGEPGSAPP
jgi:hypothetical protein